ncbi:hypothetical protein [Amycolatopsis sp. NPDC051071]|uniref:hypothetical protein n=1 Tax=Amycolatopsis sp. NPDC051071 TaxID=3154637 RepID=UPI0034192CB1
MRDHELAKVSATYASTGKQWGNLHVLPSPYDNEVAVGNAWFLTAQAQLPSTRDELYGTGKIRWLKQLFVDRTGTNGTWSDIQERAAGVEYRAGQRSEEDWNRAVVGPSLARLAKRCVTATPSASSCRCWRRVVIMSACRRWRAPPGSCETGRKSVSYPRFPATSGRAPARVAFAVPSEPGNYTLTIDAKRPDDANADLSGKVVTTWNFRSQRTAGETPLPLMVLRATPALGAANDAWRLLPLAVPIEIERSAGTTGVVRRVTAEASSTAARPGTGSSSPRPTSTGRPMSWRRCTARPRPSRCDFPQRTSVALR